MIRCLIVEDEPLAVDILQDYIRQLPSLSLVSTSGDAVHAMDVLNNEKVDLMFLDIHLPGLKGLDFLETITAPPQVIVTTAYHQYALKGYEHNVVDFLLKPIEFKRFVQAVAKVRMGGPAPRREAITVTSGKQKVVIPTDAILYVESQKEYVRIQTRTGSHVSKIALSKLEEKLNRRNFMRIHRSFIVSLDHVTAFSQHDVEVGGTRLPIGGNYHEIVIGALHRQFEGHR